MHRHWRTHDRAKKLAYFNFCAIFMWVDTKSFVFFCRFSVALLVKFLKCRVMQLCSINSSWLNWIVKTANKSAHSFRAFFRLKYLSESNFLQERTFSSLNHRLNQRYFKWNRTPKKKKKIIHSFIRITMTFRLFVRWC